MREGDDDFSLLVTLTFVIYLGKFQFPNKVLKPRLHYSALLKCFFHPAHLRAWDALWFLETFVLGFMHYKSRPGFLELHPFSFDLANYGVSVMYEAVEIWEAEQSWWDVLPLLKLQFKCEKFM